MLRVICKEIFITFLLSPGAVCACVCVFVCAPPTFFVRWASRKFFLFFRLGLSLEWKLYSSLCMRVCVCVVLVQMSEKYEYSDAVQTSTRHKKMFRLLGWAFFHAFHRKIFAVHNFPCAPLVRLLSDCAIQMEMFSFRFSRVSMCVCAPCRLENNYYFHRRLQLCVLCIIIPLQ